jgi:serine phosphatase RsbU (regulator of sigma subunit)
MLIVLSLIITNLWFSRQTSKIQEIVSTLSDIDRNIQTVHKLEKDFFQDETINPVFYETGLSQYLFKRKALVEATFVLMKKLKKLEEKSKMGTAQDIEELSFYFMKYEDTFRQLVDLIEKRGFKDYGLEGRMRHYIHQIENSHSSFDRVLLLTARRHEKDYILRKDMQYVEKLKETLDFMQRDLEKKVISKAERERLFVMLAEYEESFEELVKADLEIGFDYQKGVRGEMDRNADSVALQVKLVSDKVMIHAEKMRSNVRIASFSVMSLAFSIGIILSIFVSRSLGQPIRQLSNAIHEVIANQFSKDKKIHLIDSKDEVGILSKDFAFMLTQVQQNIDEIATKNEILEVKQKTIMDSLRYAQQIQMAILPSEEDFKQIFDDYFLIYKAQQVVSGDFYWLAKKDDKVFLAMVDCTGHGVPGAFMSMIGYTLLNKIVNEHNIHNPALMLEVLHLEIQEALHQHREGERMQQTDGMDIAICVIQPLDNQTGKLVEFAAAKQQCVYIKNGFMHELKGSKRGIGGKNKTGDTTPFEAQSFKLESGDSLYLYTDGFGDQHNSGGVKFGKKNLRELIASMAHSPLQEQKDILLYHFDKHKGSEFQRDDVTLLAVKI